MKTCYIKCQSNKQAQELRPHLVEVGFVDDIVWNDKREGKFYYKYDCITIFGIDDSGSFDDGFPFSIYQEDVSIIDPHLHTVPPDADLVETAKLIKELFKKQ